MAKYEIPIGLSMALHPVRLGANNSQSAFRAMDAVLDEKGSLLGFVVSHGDQVTDPVTGTTLSQRKSTIWFVDNLREAYSLAFGPVAPEAPESGV